MVRCLECGNIFNDATCWPVCPHNSLKAPHDLPYCRRHNLYNCKRCPEDLPAKMSPQEWDGQFLRQVKLVGSKFAPEFLAVDQKSRRLVEYHDKKYVVTVWMPPDSSAYVEAEPIYDGSRPKDEPTMPPCDILMKWTNGTCKPRIEKTATVPGIRVQSPGEVDQGDDLAGPHCDGLQTISVRRANELGDAARSAVESLLDRKVADEEHVTVMAYPAQPAETAPDRAAVPARAQPVSELSPQPVPDLIEDLDSMAVSARHTPEEEIDALIEEAFQHVRYRRS